MVEGKRRFPSDWGSPPTKCRRDFDDLCSSTDAVMQDATNLPPASLQPVVVRHAAPPGGSCHAMPQGSDQGTQRAPESREELRARLLAQALQQQSLYRQQCANVASGLRINPC